MNTVLDNTKTANKLALVGVLGNIVLVVFKFIAGFLGNSMAMISDAIHSLSDVVATAIAWIGNKIAQKDPDKKHPYGHERFECLAALILGGILLATALSIGYSGIKPLIDQSYLSKEAPTALALIGAIGSIVIKEAMYRYTKHYAALMNSSAFMADAQHHRSDALSSIGALVGIGLTLVGFAPGDALATIVICFFILKVAFEVVKDAVDRIIDTPCSNEEENAIRETISSIEGIKRIDLLRTRVFGNKIYVDAEIAVDGTLSLYEAHEIAEAAHDRVEETFHDVKHIMIHVNPV